MSSLHDSKHCTSRSGGEGLGGGPVEGMGKGPVKGRGPVWTSFTRVTFKFASGRRQLFFLGRRHFLLKTNFLLSVGLNLLYQCVSKVADYI